MRKKSYRLKFEKEVSFPGMNACQEEWLLISNAFDKTLSRNAVAYSMMQRFEDIICPMEFCYVDLYLNGEYFGVYLLCQKPQMDETSMLLTENSADNFTFFLELSVEDREIAEGRVRDLSYFVIDGKVYALKEPDLDGKDPKEISAKADAIRSFMQMCHSVMRAGDWHDVEELFDVRSFAATYLIQEIFANTDVWGLSFYIYRNANGKLACGPVWDFDIGGGNSNYVTGNKKSCPSEGYLWAAQNKFYDNLLQYPEFAELVRSMFEKYDTVISEVLETANPESKTGYYQQYQVAIERNFEKYPVMGEYVWPEPEEVYLLDTAYEQFDYLYKWLSSRFSYLKEYYEIA